MKLNNLENLKDSKSLKQIGKSEEHQLNGAS